MIHVASLTSLLPFEQRTCFPSQVCFQIKCPILGEMGGKKIQKALVLLVFLVAGDKLKNYAKLWGSRGRYANVGNVCTICLGEELGMKNEKH